ncbi:hypothetical protein [Brevibacillus centrosporus]|uniref:Uncharacterized protein n=1 Tax=Brevibacillus centrosporus TaxID=54910 RepID=A0A1I3LXZ4_9BACL|nr:hypothetical protein [Brevibacillus centrosporus]SFI89592.1 hypothetical protein SAMN05518846_101460 [Brevibacillus centrosporus]
MNIDQVLQAHGIGVGLTKGGKIVAGKIKKLNAYIPILLANFPGSSGYVYTTCVDDSGNIVVQTATSGANSKYTKTGQLVWSKTIGSYSVNDQVMDGAGNLYCVTQGREAIKINADGTQSIYIGIGHYGQSVDFDAAGNLYGVTNSSDSVENIFKMNANNTQAWLISDTREPYMCRYDKKNDCVYITYGNGDVEKRSSAGALIWNKTAPSVNGARYTIPLGDYLLHTYPKWMGSNNLRQVAMLELHDKDLNKIKDLGIAPAFYRARQIPGRGVYAVTEKGMAFFNEGGMDFIPGYLNGSFNIGYGQMSEGGKYVAMSENGSTACTVLLEEPAGGIQYQLV